MMRHEEPDLSYEQELREECEALHSHLDITLNVLGEVESYLDDRADINDHGGPNEAMQLLREVRAAIKGKRLP
jgi:hypothetical protein